MPAVEKEGLSFPETRRYLGISPFLFPFDPPAAGRRRDGACLRLEFT
jgi:hypothetical protein